MRPVTIERPRIAIIKMPEHDVMIKPPKKKEVGQFYGGPGFEVLVTTNRDRQHWLTYSDTLPVQFRVEFYEFLQPTHLSWQIAFDLVAVAWIDLPSCRGCGAELLTTEGYRSFMSTPLGREHPIGQLLPLI